MEPAEYRVMYQVEDHHWWYRGMAGISYAIARRWLPVRKTLRILDAGCGTGSNLQKHLPEFGSAIGVDLSLLALQLCRSRHVHSLACASVSDLPLPAQSFDLVTSFDVLYSSEVPDVPAALDEMARILVPGGYLLLRVPAYNWLRGRHDLQVHTARRFTLRQVAALLGSSGYKILHITYANMFLFPLALVKRLTDSFLPQRTAASDLSIHFGWLNQVLLAVLRIEALMAARITLPFGLSVIALAQRK